MNPVKFYLVLMLALFFSSCTKKIDEENNKTNFKGEYLGQAQPIDSAEIFAPDFVSTEFNERDAAFSPDGNEFFYSLRGSSFHSLIRLVKKENKWMEPETASFSGKYADLEPCYSPDGTKLFFVSNRPLDGVGEPKDYDIWYVEKENKSWGEPKNLGSPINTDANEFYPSFTEDGTIYFCARYETGIGGEDLYYSILQDGEYLTPVNLGDSVNSARDEFNSFVAPDGSYIMFTSMGWGAGFGGGDLLISFKKPNNSWSKPINMGGKVNTPFFEYCPSLSPDGKYLFFTSNRSSTEKYSEVPMTYSDIIQGLNSILNGNQNIYWIKTDFIKNLR